MAERSFVIGTAADCDVRLTDEYVSNHHARVWMDADGQAWIEDLGSTNGTWVGGGGPLNGATRVLGPTRIAPGVVIYVGHSEIPWTPR